MIAPETAGLKLSLRPPYRPQALSISLNHAGIALLTALGALGIVIYIIKLITAWGDRAEWAYPTVVLMFILSTATAARADRLCLANGQGVLGTPARAAAAWPHCTPCRRCSASCC